MRQGAASEHLVEVDGLTIGYPNRAGIVAEVVRDVTFSIDPGAAVGVVGETGCGKSTVASALLGFGRKSWWISLAVMVAVAIPFGRLWLDYLTVLQNSHVPLTYSLLDLPLTLAPVIAFLGRTRELEGARRVATASASSPGAASM